MNSTQQNDRKKKLTRGDSAHRELDNRVRVITPENIEFDYRVAGPFIRGLAYAIDVAILTAIIVLLVFIYAYLISIWLVFWLRSSGMDGTAEVISALGFAFLGIFGVVLFWGYGAFSEARFHGRTIGKKLTKLRVITRQGHKITYGQAFTRNLVRFGEILPFIPFGTLIFGVPVTIMGVPSCLAALIAMTLNSKNQRIGDILAGTMVIIEEKTYRQRFAKFNDPRVAQLAEYVPAGYVVSAELTKALADYGLRRNNMPIGRAREIAGHLAKYLLIEFNLPSDTCPDLLLCALYYRTFVKRQSGDPDFEYQSRNQQGQAEPYVIS